MSDTALPAVPSVALRLYASFAEVRLKVESTVPRLDVTLPGEAWQQVVPHSLTLLGLPFASFTLTPQDTWLTALEGQTLWLRTPEGRQDVTLIRAQDRLVRDAAGAYFHAEERHLLFAEPPPTAESSGGMKLRFDLRTPGEGVLSYQTEDLTWQALYTLEVDGQGQAQLTAYAEIQNGSDQPLVPEEVTLLAGEVEGSRRRSNRRSTSPDLLFAAPPEFLPELEESREVAGLYTFTLQHPPALPPHSEVTVPFQPVMLEAFQSMAALLRHFDTQSVSQGACTRHYVLRAAQPLLGARVTVREQGYLVGQSQWLETAAGAPAAFSLGTDPDVLYTRRIRLQEQPADPSRPDTLRTACDVTYTFRNAKTRPVPLRLSERVFRETLRSLEGEAVLQGEAITFETVLQPGEIRELRYRVVLEEEGE